MIEVLIAVAIGAGILAVGVWAVRMLATPIPEGPDPEDLVELVADYRCSVCGLRLTVTHAQGDEVKAPRHCREEMDPV